MKITILFIISSCFFLGHVLSTDTLTISESLSVNKTLISATGKFEMGFFSRGSPTKYYVGIWYKDIPSNDIVWVANRDTPLYTDLCYLRLGDTANIMLLDGGPSIRWETNVTGGVNPILQLLDSGNLVVREVGDPSLDNFIWQSFDYPTDTLLPEQKLGWSLKTGLRRILVSWRGLNDPGSGNFTHGLDSINDPELYIKDMGKIVYRSGPWVGQRFSGIPEITYGSESFNSSFYMSPDEFYFTFRSEPFNKLKIRLTLSFDGASECKIWGSSLRQWTKFWYSNKDQCDSYNVCGPNGICDVSDLFVCKCPKGFEPKNEYAWGLRDWSDGCVRKTISDCASDGFLKLDNMKSPRANMNVFVDKSLHLDHCREMCKKNCSCTAYADAEYIKNVGSGCLIWTVDLIDMRNFIEGGGQPLYIRVDAASLASSTAIAQGKVKKLALGVGVSVVVTIILVGFIIFIIRKRKIISRSIQNGRNSDQIVGRGELVPENHELPLNTSFTEFSEEVNNVDDVELPIFDLSSLALATDNFSEVNRLGQGGFGRVYKGVMLDGQEVAVKRLSKESGQGSEEFKNEVRSIAKLQHRNLVRLLGCCVDIDEKMLVYEFLQNRSLDTILFHQKRNALLNWKTRFNIICGIARGLLYLHQDSRYRIIHRDLKASNILLDVDMNPKISDFGMARIFGGDESEGSTMRVVGTYGYMAPEYAMGGHFSTKSDVFSFGVLVLEILSGKKNRGFFNSDYELNLLGYSWKQWRDGKGSEILDKSIGEKCSTQEMLRCLQVGLLCVQERPEDRPTMGSVVLMLSTDSMSLPEPKLPGFYMGWNPVDTESSSSNQERSYSVNRVTITTLNPR